MTKVATALDPTTVARLRAQAFTYADVGATLTGAMPAGWHSFTHTAVVPGDLDELWSRLLRWQVQLGSGLRVASSDAVIAEGTVAVVRLGPLPIPVRVVAVVDEPDRRGFVYGTLPGHPESGEELFVLERTPGTTQVRMVVTAFSRPGGLLARVGGPATRWVQGQMARRYLRSLS